MMDTKQKNSRALLALTTAALALPGMVHEVVAAAQVERGASVRGTIYTEDSVDGDVQLGVEERYKIGVFQGQFATPVGEKADVVASLSGDFMSGASPWYISHDASSATPNKPQLFMSGATIEDDRIDGSVKGTYYFEQARLAGTLGFSTENDYKSIAPAVEGQWDLNNKMTTLAGGLSASFDTITPTEGGDFFRPEDESKRSVGSYVGVTQILDRNSLMQFNFTYTNMSGYLSDPYKLVLIDDEGIQGENRPDDRNQYAYLMRYNRFLPSLAGALHLDYRFYADDWGIDAHTVETSWYQNFDGGWQLIPSLRYYMQSEADFYQVYYTTSRTDGFHSSDYRLSPYGAISGGAMVKKSFGKEWDLSVDFQRYVSSADYSFEDVQVENPALVSFWTVSLGAGMRF